MHLTGSNGPIDAVKRSDYGVNRSADKRSLTMISTSTKIFMVDYQKGIAEVMGSPPLDPWDKWMAPRHSNMLNVVFFDGHVETLNPIDIDPRVPAKQTQWWDTEQ